MGIGIGGDYPLSAVIASEFSATKIRGRLMCAVFAAQGWGNFSTYPNHEKRNVKLSILIPLPLFHSRCSGRPCHRRRIQELPHARRPDRPTSRRLHVASPHRPRLHPRLHRALLPSHDPRDPAFHHGYRAERPAGRVGRRELPDERHIRRRPRCGCTARPGTEGQQTRLCGIFLEVGEPQGFNRHVLELVCS